MPDFGDGSPRENYGEVDPYAPSVANGMITPEQWAAYKRKRHRDALLGILGTFGGTVGLGALGQWLGGAGAGAAGSLGAGAGATGGVGPSVGAAPFAGAGGAGAGAGIGAGAAGAGAGIGKTIGDTAGDAAGGLFGGMDVKDWLSIALGLGGTIGGALSPKPDMNPTTATTDPQLAELISLMSGRMKKSESLHDSILAMANGLLPTQYQKGGGGMP